MDRNHLQHQVAYMRNSLFDQRSIPSSNCVLDGSYIVVLWGYLKGYLDEQFIQLEDLQDDANPNFVEEIVTLFYSDSTRLIQNIEQALINKPIDFGKLDDYMHQFKGSSSSIGARKVKVECTHFREYCSTQNAEGCIRTFQQVKQEYAVLKRKLETYFQLVRQAGFAQTA